MKATLTLEFDSPAELAAAVAKLNAIAYEDRPDVGAEPARPVVATPAPTPTPSPAPVNPMGFGQGVTLPAGATPVPSAAVAAPSMIAPAVPGASSTVVPATPAPAPLPALVVPVAPPPAPPAAPSPLAVGELTHDSNGLPWDHRIHASTKGVNKDGSWKARKNLDSNVKAQVEAELRQGLAVNAALAPVPAAPVPAAPVPAPLSPAQVAVAAPPATAAAGLTGSGQPIPTDFPTLMEMFAGAMGAGRMTTADIQAALTPHGLASMGQLSYTPNAVVPVATALAHLL